MRFQILVFFLLHSFISVAQNWELIQEDEIYYYSRTDSVGIVNSMRVEDFTDYGDSTLYILYDNYLIQIDTCIESSLENIGGSNDSICGYYERNLGSILGKQIIVHDNGDYFMNPGNRLIISSAAIDSSWVYDDENQIYASVISIQEEGFSQIMDSIKTIHLRTIDSIFVGEIKISKHYGIVRFPFNENDYFELEELQSQGFGFSEMSANLSIEYSIGDVLVFDLRHWRYGEYMEGDFSTARMEIIGIDSSQSHLSYITDVAEVTNIFSYDNGWDLDFYSFVEGFEYDPIGLYRSTFSPPGEIAPLRMFSPFFSLYVPLLSLGNLNDFIGDTLLNASSIITFYPEQIGPSEAYNLLSPEEGQAVLFKGFYWDFNTNTYNGSFVSKNSSVLSNGEFEIEGLNNFTFGHDYYGMLFQEDRGLVYFGTYRFEYELSIQLVGMLKDGITYGNVPTASQILGVEKSQGHNELKVYPNPFIDRILIDNINKEKIELEIYTLLGDLVHKTSLEFGINEIDLSENYGNAFILKFISDKGVSIQKVLRVN